MQRCGVGYLAMWLACTRENLIRVCSVNSVRNRRPGCRSCGRDGSGTGMLGGSVEVYLGRSMRARACGQSPGCGNWMSRMGRILPVSDYTDRVHTDGFLKKAGAQRSLFGGKTALPRRMTRIRFLILALTPCKVDNQIVVDPNSMAVRTAKTQLFQLPRAPSLSACSKIPAARYCRASRD